MKRSRRSQAGFTLLELMISLVMFSFAIAGVMSVAVTLTNGYREQKDVVATETSARAAMSFIGDALRQASPGVGTENIQNIHNCALGSFSLTDSTTAPDDVTVVFAYGSIVTQSLNPYSKGGSTLDVIDTSQFQAGDYVLLSNYTVGHIVQITNINSATQLAMNTTTCSNTVLFPNGDTAYGRGALVIRVARARFYVAPLDGVPTLWMDPDAEGTALGEPLAEGVEDFQVELGTDTDGNGIVENGTAANDDEWTGNKGTETPLAPSAAIRAIRVTIVARSINPVNGTASYTRPAAANRAAATGPDNYRRRILRSVFEIRNIGGSP